MSSPATFPEPWWKKRCPLEAATIEELERLAGEHSRVMVGRQEHYGAWGKSRVGEVEYVVVVGGWSESKGPWSIRTASSVSLQVALDDALSAMAPVLRAQRTSATAV